MLIFETCSLNWTFVLQHVTRHRFDGAPLGKLVLPTCPLTCLLCLSGNRSSLCLKQIKLFLFRSGRDTLLVAQLVEALCYKPEGRVFDSEWCHWNFSLTKSFRPHYGPAVDSVSNGNKYQEYFLGIKAAGA